MGHLEVAVGVVVVADEAEAVGADRDRGVRPTSPVRRPAA